MRDVLLALAVMLFAAMPWRAEAAARHCALALVLAIDVSGSVDGGEYALQIGGLAAALRSDEVVDALALAGPVYATALHWSGNGQQIQVVPWTLLEGRAGAAAFAAAIELQPRQFDKYSTAIGEALAFANDRFTALPGRCRRHVIDVSGDGRSNEGWSPHLIRDHVVRQGVTINALAIQASDPGLKAYFERQIIGGAGAFVIAADQFEDYPRAIKKKLVREILPPIAAARDLRQTGAERIR